MPASRIRLLLALAVAFSLGAIAVFQAGLNRRIAATWGLAPTIFLNGVMVALLAGGFFFAAQRGWLDAVAPGASPSQLKIWWLLPGVFGFLLITGLPWAVARIGALEVFVGVVAAQMAASLIWDAVVERIALSPARVGGALLCLAGVARAVFGKRA